MWDHFLFADNTEGVLAARHQVISCLPSPSLLLSIIPAVVVGRLFLRLFSALRLYGIVL